MGTEKRDRQKANKAARLAAEQAAAARKKQLRFARNVVILVVAIVVVGFLLAGCGSSDSDGGSASTTTAAGAGDEAPDGADSTEPGAGGTPASGEAEYGTTECPPAEGVDEPKIDFEASFAQCIDPAKTYTATVTTTEGVVVLELDTERTPVTANNFVALARNGYYDGTDLFRTEASSGIIQGGSPHTQDNSDPGPGQGYFVPDEGLPFSSEDYAPGTIAMANSGTPNSGGAQFFFLANEGGRYLGDEAQLGPAAGSYVVFGTVTEGLDVLEAIAALEASPGAGVPSKTVTIETVTITES